MSAAENGASGSSEREKEDLEVLAGLRRSLEEIEEEESRPTPYNLALNKILGASTRMEIDGAREITARRIEEHPGDNLEFRRYGSDLFRKEKELELEEERRKGWGPREWKQEEVAQRAYRAETLEEIAGAKEEIAGAKEEMRRWLEKHPGDAQELEDAKDELEEKEEDELERVQVEGTRNTDRGAARYRGAPTDRKER